MLNVLSLFSGIGAFEKALENLNIPYKLLAYCEIDKFASKSYSLIHNVSEDMNLKDVTKVDILDIDERVDLITYGFPCQDISLAGKGKGFKDEDGNLTRSGLFFEAARIIDDYKPKFAIAENVKALTMKKHKDDFETVLSTLEEIGYNNYYQVLNAKDFGIPQNRERVFIISIRKDIDTGFIFPEPFKLELRLKDMLENEVDEKYYLSKKTISQFVINTKKQKVNKNGFKFTPTDGDTVAKTITSRNGSRMTDNFIDESTKVKQVGYIKKSENGKQHQSNTVYDPNSVSKTLTATDYKCPPMITEEIKVNRLGGLYDSEKSTHQAGSVYDKEGLSPTLTAMQGGNLQPFIIMPEATKKGYTEAHDGDGVYINRPHQKRGVVQKGLIQTLKTSPDVGVVVDEELKNE